MELVSEEIPLGDAISGGKWNWQAFLLRNWNKKRRECNSNEQLSKLSTDEPKGTESKLFTEYVAGIGGLAMATPAF